MIEHAPIILKATLAPIVGAAAGALGTTITNLATSVTLSLEQGVMVTMTSACIGAVWHISSFKTKVNVKMEADEKHRAKQEEAFNRLCEKVEDMHEKFITMSAKCPAMSNDPDSMQQCNDFQIRRR